MPDPVPILTSARLVLRPPIPADAQTLVDLGRDPEVAQWYGLHPETVPPLDLTWAQGWLAEQADACSWIITRDGALIGSVNLHKIWRNEGRAHLAIGLQTSGDCGQGYGREAIGLVLDHAFGPLGLHRIGLRVMETNTRAIRCYAACGFVEEGREREAALTPAGRVDDVMMGILASEWRAAA